MGVFPSAESATEGAFGFEIVLRVGVTLRILSDGSGVASIGPPCPNRSCL